jgi:pyridoxal phosphate enzyme (YggS family)
MGGIVTVSIEHLLDNLQKAEALIEAARLRGGHGQTVGLVAATKYVAPVDMWLVRDAGIRVVGENRAAELMEKRRLYGDAFEYHFIGHLQHRKVRDVLPYMTMLHSLDSLRLVAEIHARADKPLDALLQVNVSGEESKYGILPGDTEAFLEQAAPNDSVRICGFMTMAPLVSDPEEARPVFHALRELRDRLAPIFASRYALCELSMGMSNDFEVAVEEGATLVRLGSTLFSHE